jgi:hypothetical protein
LPLSTKHRPIAARKGFPTVKFDLHSVDLASQGGSDKFRQGEMERRSRELDYAVSSLLDEVER